MFNVFSADFPWVTLAVIFVTVAIAGLIGYVLGRRQYKDLIDQQSDVLAGEMRRLLRRAATADREANRMQTEVDRQRRRARR